MEQNRPEFESLSDRALLELHEPDNFNTFVSSPLYGTIEQPTLDFKTSMASKLREA